jgi:D-sedoheptulose 7-phosphate isomerase
MPSKMRSAIRDHLAASAAAFAALSADEHLHDAIVRAAEAINAAFERGSGLYIAGNGGSAADAQHFAAELVGCFGGRGDKPLPAIALTTDTSFLTAWGNDDSFDAIFARQLRAHAKEGDVFFAISTSGSSANILRGLEAAEASGLYRIGLFGQGSQAAKLCDVALHMPAKETPYVQELHMAVIHAICGCIDRT